LTAWTCESHRITAPALPFEERSLTDVVPQIPGVKKKRGIPESWIEEIPMRAPERNPY
jgi:hypothetical protein